MIPDTTSPAFFDEKYRADPDPWSFASNGYELGRYQAIVGALGRRQFRHAFEPGCSIGILTAMLATRCGCVDALDISSAAAEQARQRCLSLPNVRVASGSLSDSLPDGPFDLVIFSELGYYFEPEALRLTASAIVDRMVPGGLLVAAHWLGSSPDHVMSGDAVHSILGELDDVVLHSAQTYEGFRLDCWRRE